MECSYSLFNVYICYHLFQEAAQRREQKKIEKKQMKMKQIKVKAMWMTNHRDPDTSTHESSAQLRQFSPASPTTVRSSGSQSLQL